MALGSAFTGASSRGSLKQLLETSYREESVTPPPTPESYYRISKISSVCAREEVLCYQHQVTRKETLDAKTLLIFLHGTSLHWGLQNHALPAIDVLYGQWKCLECGTLHGEPEPGKALKDTVILRPSFCKKCKAAPKHRGEQVFQFVEHFFVSDEHKITGHPDGFLVLPGLPGMGVFEAKSVGGKNAWEVKRAPNIGHVIQAQIYMWFTGFTWGRILYWEKGTNGLEALAEHHIERDDDTINNVLANISAIKTGMLSGILPDRICATDDCPRANVCSTTKKCFAVER
jgi:hypothetical protein